METIKELREKLQKEKLVLRREYWGYKTFRGISIYITRLLIPTPVRPNHVSALMILVGLLGGLLTFYNSNLRFLGIVLLYAGLTLDEVDGELARYRRQFSLRGVYLDAIHHLLVPPFFLLCLTFGVFRETSQFSVLAFGVTGAFSWLFLKAMSKIPQSLYIGKYLAEKHFTLSVSQHGVSAFREKKGILKVFLGYRHQVREYFVGMVVVFFAFFADQFFLRTGEMEILRAAIIVYGAFLALGVLEEIVKTAAAIEERIRAIEKSVRPDEGRERSS